MPEPRHRESFSAVRHIAEGYALVILGMTSALFLYVGLSQHWPPLWWIPVHVLSVVLLLAGGWWWWRMPPLTANWLRTTEQFVLAALLQAYMVPFIVWWRSAPQVPFFAANVLVALAGAAWLLLMLCAVIAETGRILGDRLLNIEGRLCVWIAPLLLVVPLAFSMARSALFFFRAGMPFAWDTVRVGLLWPGWAGTLMLAAPVVALSVSVGARLRCLRAARLLKENISS